MTRRLGNIRGVLNWAVAVAVVFCAEVGASAASGEEPPPSMEKAEPRTDGTSSAIDIATQARGLAARGEWAQALEMGKEALVRAKGEFGNTHVYVAYIYDDLASSSYRLGHLAEAEKYSRSALAVASSHLGEDSLELASMRNNNATILAGAGRYKEALPVYLSAYNAYSRASGPNEAQIAQLARNTGLAYQELSDWSNAETYLKAALDSIGRVSKRTPDEYSEALLDLATLYVSEERPEDARAVLRGMPGLGNLPQSSVTLWAKKELLLARIEIQGSDFGPAEARLNEAITILDQAGMGKTALAASVLYNIGFIYAVRGNAIEAEPIYKRVSRIYLNVLGAKHPAVGRLNHSLAMVYQDLGDVDEADRLYRSAIGILGDSVGEQSASVAASRLEWSLLLTSQGRTAEALVEARTALGIFEHLGGGWTLKRGYANSAMGFALHAQENLSEAFKRFSNAIALIEEARGQNAYDLAPGMLQLGEIYLKRGAVRDADATVDRAISILRSGGGRTPRGLAQAFVLKAKIASVQGRLEEGVELAKEGVSVLDARLGLAQGALSGSALGEQRKWREVYEAFLELAADRRVEAGSGDEARQLAAEMFGVAQYPHLSATAAAVDKMAARLTPKDSDLAQKVRQRQDALEQWRALDESLARQELGDGSTKGMDSVDTQMDALAGRIRELDRYLSAKFPSYTELTKPGRLEVDEVQRLLSEGEALLLHVASESESHLFLVSPHGSKSARTGMTRGQLRERVESIRKAFDSSKIQYLSDVQPLDTEAAYAIYRDTLGPFERELQNVDHLIAVLDGALQQLPLSVLLTRPTAKAPGRLADYSQLDFLGKRFAVSVLPSVSSLKALRQAGEPQSQKKWFVGFGDPVLNGPKLGASGRVDSRSRLGDVLDKWVVEVSLEALRSLIPLPDTKDELIALGSLLDADQNDLFFQGQATEAKVKQTDLSEYRIVAFATHGLLSGDFRGLAEPALVLTPPARATKLDDGLLTASEVAGLKMNADWVLLSACNTAGPQGAEGAEGLSGLAKAFFYAGSRALLVSHWSVPSDAAVLLTTGAIKELKEHPEIGRAEALRRSMAVLMNGQGVVAGKRIVEFAHPLFWAPFVTVGEGGALASGVSPRHSSARLGALREQLVGLGQ